MTTSHWNRATLESRIADPGTRHRHAGGSPDPAEIAAYAAALPKHATTGSAIVLGMTPELRTLALKRFTRVIAVDRNAEAIALYSDWVAPSDRARETIVHADWITLPALVTGPVATVLADGVFGNLPDLAAHRRLLDAIAALLSPGGYFVTRMAMIPLDFKPAEHQIERLLGRFRLGELDEAEFGFGTRLVGHHEICYDPQTYLLDNARLFIRCDAQKIAGKISDREWQIIRRYYFGGFNCILPQVEWENLLRATGWEFQIHRCHGKTWYDYYPVYACWRAKAD